MIKNDHELEVTRERFLHSERQVARIRRTETNFSKTTRPTTKSMTAFKAGDGGARQGETPSSRDYSPDDK